jgi:hypothetical protein
MQQPAKSIPLYSIVEYKGLKWYITAQLLKTTCLIGETYTEIDNNTLVIGIASPEQTAKHYLKTIN